ncbi:group 3/4 sigma-70 RNA polymerase sigma factor [Calothrix sp. HK-06]|nr:group 3/4 sigma-70 RNA polymerase sigma factor [Calothrix sp. HK-06]
MRVRQNIIELFSTFLELDASGVIGWATDAKLRRRMINAVSELSQPEQSEDFWVHYWYKLWEKAPEGLVRGHLSAYLQEVCYWAARKTITSLFSSQYTLSDCFQMVIVRVDKILKGYKPGIGFSLKNYSSVIFSSELKEILRQQNEIDICTNWRLLKKLTQKRLVESLQNAGQNPDTIERYVLAWKCYQELYAPQQASGTRRLQKPSEATWQSIAQLYNQLRMTQLTTPGAESNPEMIEKWLNNCASSVRTYLYPDMTSLNAPKGEDEGGELQDILPQLTQESYISEIIANEEQRDRQSQQAQIGDVLVKAITELDSEAQKLLQYYYAQQLKQQQIASLLGVKQYTVSRRLAKVQDTLLFKVATWSQEAMHISLNSSVLNYISTVLEEWLQAYYSPNSP